MRITRLTPKGPLPVRAKAIISKDRQRHYFEIRHGYRGVGYWEWVANLSYKFFKPRDINDELVLSDDNYALLPIIKKGTDTPVKDKLNNIRYNIVIDENTEQSKDDVIVLWEPPLDYTDIRIDLNDNIRKIGIGVGGRLTENNKKIEMPVFEITGDASIRWTGKGKNPVTGEYDITFSQIIYYQHNTNNFHIKPIEEI